jgi:hypothetical protein
MKIFYGNKNSTVNNKLKHNETVGTRNIRVTTKPDVLQSPLGPINLPNKTVPFKNINTETNLSLEYSSGFFIIY